MTVVAPPRWTWKLRTATSLGKDLGLMGTAVDPRTGPGKRTHAQKEEYALRRLLAAWTCRRRLAFPVVLHGMQDRAGVPDFILEWPDGHSIGVEVTEAGSEPYQRWLTATEDPSNPGDAVLLPDVASSNSVADFVAAIEKKVKAYNDGKYRAPAECHLLVFDNTAHAEFESPGRITRALHARRDLAGRFAQVHIAFGQIVALDVFGAADLVDVSESYEVDYAKWAERQAELLRRGETESLDLPNLAEEVADLSGSLRRALLSHIRNLLVHLLKVEFQPARRSRSWLATITNARIEIRDLLVESPSLRRELATRLPQQYERARKLAAQETGLPAERFPEVCPYTPEQLVDEDFLPRPTVQEEWS